MDALYKLNFALLILNVVIIYCTGNEIEVKGDTRSCYKRGSCEGRTTSESNCKFVKGDRGDAGMTGIPGVQGVVGMPGDIGLPGKSGSNAMCGCENIEVKQGKQEFEIFKSCKSLPAGFMDGLYNISSAGKSIFQVHCEKSTTCIKRDKTIAVPLKDQTKSFWLSEKEINILYNIPEYEITALQSIYLNVKQYITFFCKDVHVFYNKMDNSSAVGFWTWNDLHMNIFPTDAMPVNYHMGILEDSCRDSESVDGLKSSIIELKSSVPSRLPVRDIYIRDLREGEQELKINIGDLCFF